MRNHPEQDRIYEFRPERTREETERPEESRPNYNRAERIRADYKRIDYNGLRRKDAYREKAGHTGRKRSGKAAKVFKGILIFLAVLLIAIAVIWIVPGWKEATAKALLKSPLATPVAWLVMGGDYERNVHDKSFDRSQLKKNDGAIVPEGNMSVALFGLDARVEEVEQGAMADSIMVVNVDGAGDIKMASIYRDTYLLGYSRSGSEIVTKANSSYYRGGPLGAVNMLNENFDLALDDYIVVNFWGFAKIVDLLGGLRLKVTEEERALINEYLYYTSEATDIAYIPLEESGDDVLLTGDQATAFCRCRYIEFTSPQDGQTYRDDYARAARQRYALMSLFSQTKQKGVFKMMQVMRAMIKSDSDGGRFIQTSMELGTLVKFFAKASDMNIAGNAAFPALDRQYTAMLDSGDTVVADTLEENVTLLHEFLYGQWGYVPTQALAVVADKIRAEVDRQR